MVAVATHKKGTAHKHKNTHTPAAAAAAANTSEKFIYQVSMGGLKHSSDHNRKGASFIISNDPIG